jgi:hypothetical protein
MELTARFLHFQLKRPVGEGNLNMFLAKQFLCSV